MSRQPSSLSTCLFAWLLAAATAAPAFAASDDNWPQMRGPHDNGVAAPGVYPVKFSANEGVAWKTELPGLGMSTPAVWGDKIFLTCGIDGQDGVVAYDFKGDELWRKTLGRERAGKNKNASGSNSSPVTDGKRLVVYYKSGTLACLDLAGNIQWQKNLQQEYGKDTLWWDVATSPTLVGDRVVIAVIQAGDSYLAAFSLADGSELWKEPRIYDRPTESDQAYTTPQVAEIDGRQVILTFGADHLTANDAATGKLLWDKGGDGSFNPREDTNWRVIANPVIDNGIMFTPFGRGGLLSGEQLGAGPPKRLWEHSGRGVSAECPTPAAENGRAYMLTDSGRVSCTEIATGKEIWAGDLPRNRNRYYASPVLAGGHLYCAREDGQMYVVTAIDKFAVASEPHMGEKLIASPVPVRNGLLLRGAKHLFWIPAAETTASN
jgi:outer membrane protein assembly factor BamB